MYRLGLQLTLRSGREPFVRLLVTAAAVAIGVAIMLCVLADFHAFQTTNHRPSWESTQGQPVTRNYAAATNSELWNYSNDIYRGQTIERLDVAGLGHQAPVPPGIFRLPASGQYYASPALAALIRTVPADQLSDRFPGKLAGTIGQQALTGPDELVIYVGYQPQQLAGLSATTVVHTITTAPGRQVWTSYFRDAFVAGAIAFVFPILILVGTATRLAAARREERYAALRLVGATSRQISVISSVDAVVSALLGALVGIGIFALFQPVLAGTAITSQRYFADQVTPTAAGYLAVLIAVPAASAVASLMSLRRVRISPLGVSRRVTPPAPTWLRALPLLAGIALFLIGLDLTNSRQIGAPLFPGLIIILAGLVVAGPWLTAQAARLLRRITGSAPALLATRRLDDNPRAAFRTVSGLVLAVFLGTLLAGLMPAVDKLDAGPAAKAVNNILLDGFISAPVCGNNANCNGNNGPTGATALQQRIAVDGLPPQPAAALLAGLSQISGATSVPVYSVPSTGSSAPPAPPSGSNKSSAPSGGSSVTVSPSGPAKFGPPPGAVISCAGLRELAALGQCAAGRGAVQIQAQSLFDDNPQFSTQPLATASSPAASDNFSRLYLQALLVKVNSPATLERVRTYLVTHTAESASGTAPRTFGEAIQARAGVAETVQRLIYIAVALTIIVAGCSLAVAVSGGMVERKRPFTLLRLTGTSVGTLYRVVLLEALLPLMAATIVAISIAYGLAVLTVSRMAPAGTPTPVPGQAYYVTMAAGLAGSLLVILASLPLLGRVTRTETVRFE